MIILPRQKNFKNTASLRQFRGLKFGGIVVEIMQYIGKDRAKLRSYFGIQKSLGQTLAAGIQK